MNAIRGTWYLFACRQTVSLCASTPSRALKTITAAVEHAQAPLDLGGEVDVARRVDQVDRLHRPSRETATQRRVDRDAALGLLGVVVGGRRPAIDLAGAMLRPRGEQHPLGHRRLAGIDVGDDADVANFGEVGGHGSI